MANNYRPEILTLEKVFIETPFRRDDKIGHVGFSNQFYVVPNELVINGDRDLWKGCPPMVNFDMLKCIEEIVAAGEYPYNSSVGNLYASKFGMAPYADGTFLSAVVYCTQSYRHTIEDEKKAKSFHETMIAEGFKKCTLDELREAAETDNRFYVVMNGTNVFTGGSVKVKKETPLKLKDWGEQGFYWMTPRSSRKGWPATPGQYIKQIS